MHQFSKFVHFH